ncbi:hypothetical protein LINPERHAP1_LOCUS14028 [Linum perenne]
MPAWLLDSRNSERENGSSVSNIFIGRLITLPIVLQTKATLSPVAALLD